MTESQFLEGVAAKEECNFSGEGYSFYMKNKLKSEIFNKKKKTFINKTFFSVITKNLNWAILTKTLVTWNGYDGIKNYGVH